MTRIVVVPQLAQGAVALPGGLILLDHGVIGGTDDPAVAAGHVLAAHAAAIRTDPLETVLRQAGLRTTFRLLTTGDIPADALRASADATVAAAWSDDLPTQLSASFAQANVPSGPYAGTTGADLIETSSADQSFREILSDGDWVSLQNICNS
uniref:Uncharacterized protein n=1 Tax=Yoonia rhodophyticola TaxID=3137370 RepID=A0AAN0NLM1_9RHOB